MVRPMVEDPEPEAQAGASFGFRQVPVAEKAKLVRGVFDSVAGRYDLMNDLMSAGVHRAEAGRVARAGWRRAAPSRFSMWVAVLATLPSASATARPMRMSPWRISTGPC